MASLVLSAAGGAAGGAIFGPVGAVAGRIIGAVAGSFADRALFGSRGETASTPTPTAREGPRLRDLDVMASTEGAPIPRVYGRARLSGQVIWATALEEVVTTRIEGGGGGGGEGGGGGGGGGGKGGSRSAPVAAAPASLGTQVTTYSYFANFAVGLCEGAIGHVARVWADGKLLDLHGIQYRFYPGSETQTADPLIVAKEGNAPAYRGLAYIVFERLPLADFGNRLPQVSFEVMRPIGNLEKEIRAVTLIPGSTEFGYEPGTVVRVMGEGLSAPENRHVRYADSDLIASLDELQAVCPHLERVAVVVSWFGDDLRARQCNILPKIDHTEKATSGAEWFVAGVYRSNAIRVSTFEGRVAYGGTPSDASVRNLIGELRARGLKVTLYPFVMMDVPADNALPNPRTGVAPQPAYPWRGEITCHPAPGVEGSPDGTAEAGAQVDAFFAAGFWNYRRMVHHYAQIALEAGGVDAFLIGSELKSLTRVRSAPGVYPAVAQLMTLAAEIKATLGPGTIVTYAADWTEYGAHVVDAGAQEVRFPLDPLWASPNIDVIGIDYYAPLSDWRDTAGHADREIADTIYDRAYLRGNVRGGEGYDFHYADGAARNAQARSPITDGLGKPWLYRQKDLWNFWSQPHYEREGGAELGAPTVWLPQSKPIWLTETGCPAVDKGANQPSVFPDPKSATGGYPYFSGARRDDLIQRRYLEAILSTFRAGGDLNPVSAVYHAPMVDPSAIHVWTWDARPYPVFPAAAAVWSDGANWHTGHWLNGRLGTGNMEGLLAALLADAGVTDFDVSALGEGPEGYVIERPISARAAIEPLAQAYTFDAAEDGGMLVFRPRGSTSAIELDEDDCVIEGSGAPVRLSRLQESELPREISLGFSDLQADYRRGSASSRRLVGGAARLRQSDIAMVTNADAAGRRAEIWLQDLWAGRDAADFALPPSRIGLMPGDIVALNVGGRRRLLELREFVDTSSRAVKARSIDPEIFDVPQPQPRLAPPVIPPAIGPVRVRLLDLPVLHGGEPVVLTRAAIFADPWPGPVAVWRSRDGASYELAATATASAILGETLDALPRGPLWRIDDAHAFRVKLYGGALASVPDGRLLGGANLAALQRPDGRCEVIQFGTAELVDANTYRLSRLLRGQGGTEEAMADPLEPGATFVLLDAQVVPIARGLDQMLRPSTLRVVAASRDHGDPFAVQLEAVPGVTALQPYAPVHLKAVRGIDGVTFTLIRRARVDGDSWEVAEVPLGEAAERYEIDILDGDAVKRTLTGDAPAMLYPSADEIADFGAPQAALSVRACQLSATIGRGRLSTATLNL